MKKIGNIHILFFFLIILNSINIANSSMDFEISGFVTRKDSSPINRVKVELIDGEDVKGSDDTNKQGFYRIQAKLEENSSYVLRATEKSIQSKVTVLETTQSQITVNIIVNQIPFAKIDGPDIGYVNDLITFSASESNDPDEDPLTYMWDFGDGDTSDEENPNHIFDHPGDFTVTLQIDDIDGASDSDKMKIAISNRPPVAIHNGPYSVRVDAVVQFSSDGSYDPEGDPLTYQWEFGDGSKSSEENPDHVYPEPGEYKIVLKVFDVYGEEDKTETKCVVSENQFPDAKANGPYTGFVGYPVEFSSEGSIDPDGEIQSYYWEFEDGQNSDSSHPTITFNEVGSYSVVLTVIDDSGASDTDSSDVDVQVPSLMPPIAECNGPYTGKTNAAISFSSAGSYDPDDGPLEYYWTFGNGESSVEANPSYSYKESGTYNVTLTVTDSDNLTDIESTTSTVKSTVVIPPSPPLKPNKQPVAFGEIPLLGEVGMEIQFFSNGSYDPDGEIVEIVWSFGDGFISNDENPIHVYIESGFYEVLLHVYDDEYESDTFSSEIAIFEPNIAPVVALDVPLGGKTNVSVYFSTTECYDVDGEITTYSWSFGDNFTSDLENPRHTYSSPGIYDVSLSVTDNSGTSTDAITVIEISSNISPIPIIDGKNMTKIGKVVEFSASSSYDVDGEIIEYRWDFGDGTISYHENIQHVFLEEGEKTVTLRVTDDNQATNETNSSILISVNIPPKAVTNNSMIGQVYEEIAFVSESSDIDGEIVSTFWDFGDGEVEEGIIVYHNYDSPGLYYGKLVVTDDSLNTVTENIEILINEPADETIFPFLTISTVILISVAYIFRKPWLKIIENF